MAKKFCVCLSKYVGIFIFICDTKFFILFALSSIKYRNRTFSFYSSKHKLCINMNKLKEETTQNKNKNKINNNRLSLRGADRSMPQRELPITLIHIILVLFQNDFPLSQLHEVVLSSFLGGICTSISYASLMLKSIQIFLMLKCRFLCQQSKRLFLMVSLN